MLLLTGEALSLLSGALLGVGVGLMVDLESRRSLVGLVLASAAVSVALIASPGASVFTAPVFVVAAVGIGLVRAGRRYWDSPLLEGSPSWQKLLQSVVFFTRIRETAMAARREKTAARTHDSADVEPS